MSNRDEGLIIEQGVGCVTYAMSLEGAGRLSVMRMSEWPSLVL